LVNAALWALNVWLQVKARESGSNLVADGEQVNTLAASLRNSGRLAHLKQQALLPTAGHRVSG
jgi:hypothetical protein